MTVIISEQTIEISLMVLVYIIGLLYSSYIYNYFKRTDEGIDEGMLPIPFFILLFAPISVPICLMVHLIALTSKIWR